MDNLEYAEQNFLTKIYDSESEFESEVDDLMLDINKVENSPYTKFASLPPSSIIKNLYSVFKPSFLQNHHDFVNLFPCFDPFLFLSSTLFDFLFFDFNNYSSEEKIDMDKTNQFHKKKIFWKNLVKISVDSQFRHHASMNSLFKWFISSFFFYFFFI
jgi:hypothetical protein